MILLNALLALSLISSPNNNVNESGSVYNHLTLAERTFITTNINSIVQDDTLLPYFMNNPQSNSISYDESDIPDLLESTYASYTWSQTAYNTTASTTGNIPVNVKNPYYTSAEIQQAITLSNVSSTYGGCGPLAMTGMLDYFARYLGYNEIIKNPGSSEDRIQLLVDVLTKVKTYEVGFGNKQTLTFPWDYSTAFNTLMDQYKINAFLQSNYNFQLFGGNRDSNWNTVKSNINSGMPVTLMTGLFSGDGDFAQHYTNILGYSTWTGVDENSNTISKDFIIARLNFANKTDIYYCDADILGDGMIGLITYSANSSNTSRFGAVDFAEEFVNSQGGGQYFNIEKGAPVTFLSNEQIQTYRLRTSYIENQYLVMSPNRANCGSAYLEMIFNHSVSSMTFDISLWGPNENITGQSLYTYYYDGTYWLMYESITLSDLSTNKANPSRKHLSFPSDAVGVKFYTWHTNPSGDYNRGRVCLDNFIVRY